jgi:predicted DNA-binding transcriptional regulator YafY
MMFTKVAKPDLKIELRHILERHQGRNTAVTGEFLARIVGQRNRQVRQILEELIEDGLPIVSTSEPPAGYFLAISHKEAEEHLTSLQTRIEALSHRKRKVLDNVELYWGENRQGRLL